MNDNKIEISDVTADDSTQNIPLTEEVSPLDEFKSWLKNNPEYPQNITDALLIRYLKVNDNDLEKAQKLLEYNLTIRKSAPQLFTNRDFLADEIQNATNVLQFCPLPTLTKEKYRITIGGIRDADHRKFDYVNCLKMVLMLFDTRFSEYDGDNEISEGEISVMDMKNMGWRHFMKAVTHLMTAKVYMKFLQEAVPMKIVESHIINPSAVVHRMFSLFKPFIKQELLDSFFFHQDLESLYKRIPRELLPVEWGGNKEISIEEVRKDYLKKMERNREFLMNEDNWRIKDKKDKNQKYDEEDDDDDDFD